MLSYIWEEKKEKREEKSIKIIFYNETWKSNHEQYLSRVCLDYFEVSDAFISTECYINIITEKKLESEKIARKKMKEKRI